jgi:hypothetical protein
MLFARLPRRRHIHERPTVNAMCAPSPPSLPRLRGATAAATSRDEWDAESWKRCSRSGGAQDDDSIQSRSAHVVGWRDGNPRWIEAMARHQTQWAAQFAVASELCKRGYEVSFTLGHNTPLADLTAISPEEHFKFLIDVKGWPPRITGRSHARSCAIICSTYWH